MTVSWSQSRLGAFLQRHVELATPRHQGPTFELTVRLHGLGVVARRAHNGAVPVGAARTVARAGQFVLSRIDARNGALGIVPPDLDGALVSNDFPVFSVDDGLCLPAYLGWLCRTRPFVGLCSRASAGTTNRVRLKLDAFLDLELPLPPLAEQRRIVERIEGLAARIAEAKRLREESRAEAEAVIATAASRAVVPDATGWRRASVGDVVLSMGSGWSPQCEDTAPQPGEWGVLKTTAVQWGCFDPRQAKALPTGLQPRPACGILDGDVLVTRAGPTERVGVVAVVSGSHPRLMASDKLIRLRCDTARVLPSFMAIALASAYSQTHLVQRKTGLAAAQVNISQAILRSTPVSFPPLPDQARIVAYLDDLRARVDAVRKLQDETAEELDALLPSILDRAFRGEL